MSHSLSSSCPYCGKRDAACSSVTTTEGSEARKQCRLKVEQSRSGKDPWE